MVERDEASIKAETLLCWCEKMKETTSRHGSDERYTEGCLLRYNPVFEENQTQLLEVIDIGEGFCQKNPSLE